MKTSVIYVIGCLVFTLLVTEAFSQRGRGGFGPAGYGRSGQHVEAQQARHDFLYGIESLSQEQRDKIRELQVQRREQSLKHRAEVDELRARKRNLMVDKDSDMGAVNRVIDQMTARQAQWMKENAAHRQAIRNLLTDEQRIIFDSQTAGRPVMRQMDRRSQRGYQPNPGRGRR